jgi:hypothetical protein
VHIVDEREKQQSHPTGRVPALLFAVAMVCTLPQPAEAQFTQQGYALVGTGAIGPANQGYSVSLSSDGNTAIVGGANDSGGFGAAWIFTRSSGLWAQQGNKLAGNGTCYDVCLQPQQGYSVALSADGNTALMGAPGDVVSGGGAWVYVSTNGVWSLQQGNRASVPYLSGTDYSVSGVTSAAGGLDLAGAGRSRPGKVAGLRRMGGLLPRQWPGQRSDIRDLTAWRWLFMGRYGNRAVTGSQDRRPVAVAEAAGGWQNPSARGAFGSRRQPLARDGRLRCRPPRRAHRPGRVVPERSRTCGRIPSLPGCGPVAADLGGNRARPVRGAAVPEAI